MIFHKDLSSLWPRLYLAQPFPFAAINNQCYYGESCKDSYFPPSIIAAVQKS